MSIVSVDPISSELSIDANWHRTYTSVYQVITDDVNDGPITVVNASGIPNYGASYQWGNDSDSWAFCQAAHPRLVNVKDTSRQWYVTITHSTIARTQQDFNRESPLDWRPIISGSFAKFTKAATQDKDGNPITNSVEEPFVPALEMDDSRDSLVIQVNTPSINLALRAQARNKVNSSTIWGLPSRAVKLNQWAWGVRYYGLTPYIENQFEFEINYELWNHKQLDAGFRKLVDAGAADLAEKYRTIMDDIDTPRHQPTPLDGNGDILDLTATPAGVYLDFEIYDEFNFLALPVPNPLPGPFV